MGAQSWFPDGLHAEIWALHQEEGRHLTALKGCQAPKWEQNWTSSWSRISLELFHRAWTYNSCHCDVKGPLRCPWKVGKSPQCQQDTVIPAIQNSSMLPFCRHSRRILLLQEFSVGCLQTSRGFYLAFGLCWSASCSTALQKWSGRCVLQRVIFCLSHLQCIFIQINPGWSQLI